MYDADKQFLESQGRPARHRHCRRRLAGRVVHEHVARGAGSATDLATAGVGEDAQQVVGVVPHQVVGTVEFMDVPVRIVLDPFV